MGKSNMDTDIKFQNELISLIQLIIPSVLSALPAKPYMPIAHVLVSATRSLLSQNQSQKAEDTSKIEIDPQIFNKLVADFATLASNAKKKEEELEILSSQIKDEDKQIKDLDSQIKDEDTQIRALRSQIEGENKEIESIKEQLKKTQALISQLTILNAFFILGASVFICFTFKKDIFGLFKKINYINKNNDTRPKTKKGGYTQIKQEIQKNKFFNNDEEYEETKLSGDEAED